MPRSNFTLMANSGASGVAKVSPSNGIGTEATMNWCAPYSITWSPK
jgi:hypothetical protein